MEKPTGNRTGLLLGTRLTHPPGSDHLGRVRPKWREEQIMGARVPGQGLHKKVILKSPHVDKCCPLSWDRSEGENKNKLPSYGDG